MATIEYHREWYATRSEEQVEARRQSKADYQKKNREHINARARERSASKPKKTRAVCTEHNGELTKDGRCRECRRLYLQNRRAAETPEQRALWLNANRNRIRMYRAARRARLRNAFVENVDAQVVYERDEGICGLCDIAVDPTDYHVDHIIPLAKGGEHSYKNVQLAHPSCNLTKGDKLPEISVAD